ncbi:hypothetical protein [Streptomyces cylindrosporus]|uniref:Nuclear transport factor 2 family protein n=1 Tax=Streptomyces cylindrosporus TaxID=2927583 RepID=A0ABS9YEE8_9ACTN|nr:hypothetical protein [Streptomyces cylindrosporus]MCI3275607.1 hypothetical protein [Streptomyces cylindrosporus]
MSWTRGLLTVLAACVLLLAGSAGCGSGDAHEGKNGASTSPVGKILDGTDKEGRHLREVDKKGAPEVGIEVRPDTDDTWDVRLTVHNFRFSPAGTKSQAVAGRGFAYLFVDDRLVTRLRGTAYRLPARLVPRGTHHVTARLYADDGTVWAVNGEPVESTADITASEPDGTASGTPDASGAVTPSDTLGTAGMSASGINLRTGGRGSPEGVGKAS